MLVKRHRAILVGTLKCWDSVLIQLFKPGSLLSVLLSNFANSEVYHLRADPLNEVDIFALTKAVPLNVIRFWIRCTKNTTHHILIVDVFSYRDYFAYIVRFCIKMRVKITKI